MAEHIGWKPSLTAALGKIGETLAVRQVALTSNLIYTIPEGTPSGIVHRVVFTQDGTGGHTVTYDGDPLTIDLTAGASTTVELHPVGAGYVVRYPVADMDIQVASLAAAPTAALAEMLVDSFAPRITAPRVATLLGGHDDESFTLTSCTVTADTTNCLVGAQALKFSTSAAKTAIMTSAPFASGIYVEPHTSAIGMWVYVEDATKITGIGLWLYSDTGDNRFVVDPSRLRGGLAANLKTGWNYWRFLRIHASVVGTPTWGTFHHAELYFISNAATSVTLQAVTAEHREKASIVFIHDGGTAAFDQSPGYHDLRDRGIPVTWAIDCDLIGDATHVTRARLIELGNENHNSISFHGWNPATAPSSGFDAAAARAETAKCQKWLSALPTRGASGRMFRSAWYQDKCPQSSATDDMVLFNPMHSTTHKSSDTSWPPFDRFDYFRRSIFGLPAGGIADLFTKLQARHGVLVCYTHNVGGNEWDPTLEEWAEFLALIDEGMAAGWLECVTFEQLLVRSGVRMSRGLTGAWQVEWPEIDGTTTIKRFP